MKRCCVTFCCFDDLFSDIVGCKASGTPPMMANTPSLILLLIIKLNEHQVLPECTAADLCSLENTRGLSVYNGSIPRRSVSTSCPRVCSLNSKCIATTYNPQTENCDLHEAGTTGTPCMTLVPDLGSSFWMIKHLERSCPKVSFKK